MTPGGYLANTLVTRSCDENIPVPIQRKTFRGRKLRGSRRTFAGEKSQNLRLLFHAKWFEVTTVDVPNFKRGIDGEQCEENQINHGTSIAKLQQRRQQPSDKRPDYRMDGKPGGSRGRAIGGFR